MLLFLMISTLRCTLIVGRHGTLTEKKKSMGANIVPIMGTHYEYPYVVFVKAMP